MGDGCPNLEVNSQQFGPIRVRPCLTSLIACGPIDWHVWWAPLVAFRLESPGAWQARWWRHMVLPWEHAAWKHFEKKYMKGIWGTWESNPGPCVCQVSALPIVLLVRFVYGIGNKYYNNTMQINSITKKNAPDVWTSQSCNDTIASSSFYTCKNN